MISEESKIIYKHMMSFMGLFHEKFVQPFRCELAPQSNLKKNHFKIINILFLEKTLTLTEISKALDIEKGSLTSLIDNLEEREMVLRANDPKDRRKQLISLSPKGQEEMVKIIDFYIKKMSEYLDKFEREEVEEFRSSLEKCVDFLKKL